MKKTNKIVRTCIVVTADHESLQVHFKSFLSHQAGATIYLIYIT